MKKTMFLLSACLFFGIKSNAQPHNYNRSASVPLFNYGQIKYANTGYGSSNVIASSAFTTGVFSTGFLAADYLPSSGTSLRQVVIRKTDANGDYTTANEFNAAYTFYNSLGNSCVGPNAAATDCAGVTAIEINNPAISPGGSRYAVVTTIGGVTAGQFLVFFTLKQNGAIANKVHYKFPVSVLGYKKPYITEDPSSSGRFYICGSYIPSSGGGNETMYVLKVDTSGTILGSFSKTYLSGTGIQPTGITCSPFNSNEIVIVGRVVPDTLQAPFLSRLDDGFFLRLNSSNGAINLFRVYGSDKHQRFGSITPAFSTYGGSPGFVIGGLSERLNSNPSSAEGTWALKIHPTTGAIIWSTIIDNGGAGAMGLATGILERQNISTSVYTYFLGTSMTTNIRAIKLNDDGSLYTLGANGNLFDYNWLTPGNVNIYPTQLTYVNTSSAGDGFQLFSTNGSGTGQDNYFVKAYFDGHTGCTTNEAFTSGMQSAGPSNTISPAITPGAGLTLGTCTGFFWDFDVHRPTTANVTYNCSFTSVTGATNARMLNTQLENNNVANEEWLKAYPNPNNGSFHLKSDKELKVSVLNQLGIIVKTIDLNSENKFSSEVRDLNSGIYFIKCQDDKSQKVYKIVVEK